MTKIKMTGIALTCAMLALAAGCQPAPLEEAIPVSVRVMTVENQLIDRVHSYMGTIDTESMQKLSFPASGRIDSIDVSEGDLVEADQILAVLDPETVQLQLDASKAKGDAALAQYQKAQAGVDFARETYEKMEILYQSGAVSQFERDQAKLQLDTLIEDRDAAYGLWQQARAGVQGAGKVADESLIRAAGTGLVISVLNEAGEFVAAGYPVIVLRNPESRVRIFVSQKEIVDIQVGQNVRCQFYDEVYSGRVDWMAEVPDEDTLTYEVQISLEGADLRLGTIVDVDVILKRVQAIQVPIASLMNDSGGDYVYVVEGDVIQRKAVFMKTIDNTFVEVEGLEPGDRIVVMGMAYVEAGQTVTVREMEQ
jgi:RND family efflux transporter MFP subunit